MGYRPHAAARAMRTGRYGCVALLLSTYAGYSILSRYLLSGIESVLAEHNMHLTLASLPDDKLTSEAHVPKILRECSSDGMLINYNARTPQRMIDLIEQHQLPSVWVNFRHTANCVHPDDFAGFYNQTRRLLEMGHRRIAYADYTTGERQVPWHYSSVDRPGGYRLAMEEAGLQPRLLGPAEGALLGLQRLEYSRAWMAQPDRPTAVLTYGVSDARSIFVAATAAGLRVPGDLSLVCAADAPPNDMGPVFTTLVVPEQAEGAEATRMLLKRLAEPTVQLPAVAVPLGFVAGATVAPPA